MSEIYNREYFDSSLYDEEPVACYFLNSLNEPGVVHMHFADVKEDYYLYSIICSDLTGEIIFSN